MIKTTLYIGLNDKDTKTYLVSKDYVISRLDYYFDAYTLIEANGRYTYYNNTTFNEPALIVLVIDFPNDELKNICNNLKAELNQECIMVETQEVDIQFM